jgi:hypothetical protein
VREFAEFAAAKDAAAGVTPVFELPYKIDGRVRTWRPLSARSDPL